MNAQKLKEIAHSNPTAELMFTAWGLRERHRPITDLRRFRNALVQQGVRINEEDFYKTFDQLAAAGIGTLAHPVRGRPKYFHWRARVDSVAKAGLEGVQAPAERSGRARVRKGFKRRQHDAATPVLNNRAPVGQNVEVYVALASGRIVPVRLPHGVKEAADIIAIGKALIALAGGDK